MAPHRAVYDLKLVHAESQSGIAGMTGRMVYEFSGSRCDGYSVNFRFVTRFQAVNGGLQVTDLQTTSFEEADASSYEFLSKTFVNQTLVETSRGSARQGTRVKTVDLSEPQERSVEIGPSVQFPTEHLRSILRAGAAGGRFVASDIYDGAETGDKVYGTTTVIGERSIMAGRTVDGQPVDGMPDGTLAGTAYWPVSVAYFDTAADDASGELLPVYQLSFRLFENGISDRLVLDYGDFKLQGTMAALDLRDQPECGQ